MRRLALILFAILLTACQDDKADGVNSQNPGNTQRENENPGETAAPIAPQLADAVNRFGFNLFRELRKEAEGSLLISPASINLALSMTYNGAAGTTKEGMARALAISGMTPEELNNSQKALLALLQGSGSDITLEIANSLWSRQGLTFDSAFLSANREFYGAELRELDFADPGALGTINGWVNDRTKGKIPQILKTIPPEAILYLLNAIYFKGTWTYKFDSSKTHEGPFHHPSGDQLRQMMQQETDFDYMESNMFQAVRLPYGDSKRFGMYVFLPRPAVSIDALADSLTSETWTAWTAEFRKREGMLKLPRFTVRHEETLNDQLSALGMAEAFDPYGADFSRMITGAGGNVFINAVKHKTFMEVNEEGTEAAAVTSVEVGVTSFPGPATPFTMIVDRPFLCGIVDRESGLILFLGLISEFAS